MSGILQMLVVAGSGATTTWNPADKGGSLTLSNGNLTAKRTSISGGDPQYVRSTTSRSTGKYYMEFRFLDPVAALLVTFGFCDGTFIATAGGGGRIGANVGTAGLSDSSSGALAANGISLGSPIGTLSDNDVIGLALDLTNSKWWMRRNGGNWNGSGAADPTTNTGGGGFNTIAPPFKLVGSVYDDDGSGVTLNCGQSAFAYAAPSGFSAWG